MTGHSAITLAETWLNAKKPERALEVLRDQLRETPEDYRLIALAGRAHAYLDHREDALECADRALALAPAQDFAWRSAAAVYGMVGENERARAAASKAVELAPSNALAHLSLASALLRPQAQAHSAAEAAKEAIRLEPTNGSAHLVLGNAYLAMSDLEGAQREYQLTLQLSPGNAAAINNLGLIELRRGREGRAAAAFSGTLALDPTSDLARSNLTRSIAVSLNRFSMLSWIIAIGSMFFWIMSSNPPTVSPLIRGIVVTVAVVMALIGVYLTYLSPGRRSRDILTAFGFVLAQNRPLRMASVLTAATYAAIIAGAFLPGGFPIFALALLVLLRYGVRVSMGRYRRGAAAERV